MDVVSTPAEMSAWTAARRASGDTMGFVPTMGALHAGHLSLIASSRAAHSATAVSIFVNPTQFDHADDFAHYPRTLERDLDACARAGVDAVFIPDAGAMYPEGSTTTIDPGPIGSILEGAHRPGHFAGVATIVVKLLNIVDPDAAHFGAKDYQQVAVIRRVATDLDIPSRIVAHPTVRESDGLAMSSRNVRLAPADRTAATVIHRALTASARAHRADPGDLAAARRAALGVLGAEARADVDYLAFMAPDLSRESRDGDPDTVALVAARFGDVRLIDNLALSEWNGD